VTDAANANVFSASTAQSSTLAIFTIQHPVSTDVWAAESSKTLQWTTPQPGVPTNVKIEYNVDGTWKNLPETDGTPNDGIVTNSGSITWLLPVNRNVAAKIRISDPNDATSIIESDPFKIRGDMTITSPTAGTESWEVGTTQAVTWTKHGNITNVNLQITGFYSGIAGLGEPG